MGPGPRLRRIPPITRRVELSDVQYGSDPGFPGTIYCRVMGKGNRLRQARKQGQRCMFCGDPVGSQEHVWPRWLRKHTGLDCSGVNHTQRQQEIVMGGSPRRTMIRQPSVKVHSGATVSRKLPVVCRDRCNGGWMSRLEIQAMPLLGPLIDGTPTVLATDEQQILSRWADKTVMVMEATSPASRISSQADRQRVMDESNPAPAVHTRVWVGHNAARPHNAELRGHRTFSQGLVTPADGSAGIRSDVLTVGQVLFLVVSSSVDEWALLAPSALGQLAGKLVQIWPAGAGVQWPPPESFDTDQEVELLADSLTHDGSAALSKVAIPAAKTDIALAWPS